MKNSGCHGNQSKKTFKNLLLQNHSMDSIIILQECSLERGLQNSLKWKRLSKNMAFMGDTFSFYYGIE